MNAAKLYYTETGEATTWKGETPKAEDPNDAKFAWTDYLDEWPKIPKNVVGMEYGDDEGKKKKIKDNEGYVVNIGDDGTITVTPGLIDNEPDEQKERQIDGNHTSHIRSSKNLTNKNDK